MKMGESKQVRVDNWGIFFLQRLQLFFSKTDYCDLTLQFEGNVQLKVHRLVMNACTEYFTFLEQTCPALEENTILMPSDLQSDVIVPIVNFMYTGMLEFRTSIFEKLYKAAELMNITVLTKLLEAQEIQIQYAKSKLENKPKAGLKKATPKSSFSTPDLPPTLPGRKVPVWKRKNAPPTISTPSSHNASQQSFCGEPRHSVPSDPLCILDNTPKPTRFEWPEDDLPPIDSSFEDISLTSKPLLTKEEEEKAQHCFDDLRNNVEIIPKKNISRASSSNIISNINTKVVEDFVKEQKIRSTMFEDVDDLEIGQKRKIELSSTSKVPSKKVKLTNKEKETTISVEGADVVNIDHTKIVTEILKKYPDLVKKNKNIKLKIMPSSGTKSMPEKKVPSPEPHIKPLDSPNHEVNKSNSKKKPTITEETNEEGPWTCRKCISVGGEPQEFVLYYLYRKHMTDVHDEIFDASLCKYCGRKCSNHNLMMYHLYTKHALKPPSTYNFPLCDKCPYIAFSEARLNLHKQKHDPNEIQCPVCKLAFTTSQTLGTHIRATRHYVKPGRVSSDCQYCMKKLQSAIRLFTHIKNAHLKEAKRDGIVCLEENDSIEHLEEAKDEEQPSTDEYIVPEILPDSGIHKDKVKIISNVKVPPNRQSADNVQQTKVIPLEASSEAESLNNVASGIATSLGLVDIVVLDENQQYILQDGQHEQTEFIIPELSSGQSFAGQVITTQHNSSIPQGIIQTSGSDIGSTDELVMVLTDHDYPDEQEMVHQDNSNIVVLYSHPVEGQEGQFITSQVSGNLLVNSQTGLLEIRNGTTIATSSSQMIMTNAVDSPVESIEMIQREIDLQQEMKQEPYFEEEAKPVIQTHQTVEIVEAPENVAEEQHDEASVPESCEQEHSEEQVHETQSEAVEQEDQSENLSKSDDHVDGSMEESMEIEEAEEIAAMKENENQIQIVQETVEEENQTETTVAVEDAHQTERVSESEGSELEGVDVPPEISEESQQIIMNDPTTLSMTENLSMETETDMENVQEEQNSEDVQQENEPMEVDVKMEESNAVNIQQETIDNVEQRNEEQEKPYEQEADESVDTGNPEESKDQAADPVEEEEAVDEEEEVEEEEEREENEESVEPVTSEEVKSQEMASTNNPDSPRQNQSHKNQDKNQLDINKTILDDWEDESDSQQSEKQAASEESKQSEELENTTKAAAVDNVNKLMDDWEDEEEEDKKESE
ncbi:centrosome-associated zinc finger protein CP190 isoform X3 [Leptinotarsa decemlineata]|uniref:centrosome-associated zinc finger protein CP190 isoform X3 n=1 Tax=Leptinotarsa decemlineata TaxID=7539 RepID=UPI003D304E70